MLSLARFYEAVKKQELSASFRQLLQYFNFATVNGSGLNSCTLNMMKKPTDRFSFINHDELPAHDYYENFIFEHRQVPTRHDCWHDFFNGLIWLQFPNTKQYLNRLHVEQINETGLHPRGAIRDRTTHFDECGLCILWEKKSPHAMLVDHSWESLFLLHREQWHLHWRPIIFGHALYEQLLSPFVGLTAKAICIQSPAPIKALSYTDIDELICEYLQSKRVFQKQKQLLPIPLLGIPGWHLSEQNAEFYADTKYFMPKRKMIKNA